MIIVRPSHRALVWFSWVDGWKLTVSYSRCNEKGVIPTSAYDCSCFSLVELKKMYLGSWQQLWWGWRWVEMFRDSNKFHNLHRNRRILSWPIRQHAENWHDLPQLRGHAVILKCIFEVEKLKMLCASCEPSNFCPPPKYTEIFHSPLFQYPLHIHNCWQLPYSRIGY